MKRKDDIFRYAERLVMRTFELDEHSLYISRKEENVDARYVLYAILSKYMTDGDIARYANKSRQAISYIKSGKVGRKWCNREAVSELAAELEKAVDAKK